MILCGGDALIDFIPCPAGDGGAALRPVPGGSIHNVAVALGRLGCPTGYFGGLSRDMFGEMLVGSLAAAGVSLDYAPRSDRHTTLAFVTIEDGQPRYAFVDDCSAGRQVGEADVPALGGQIAAVHVGSINLIRDPVAGALEALVRRASPDRVVSLDPNIRPSLIADRDGYLARHRRLLGSVDILKLSVEDMAWLAPGAEPAAEARAALDRGVSLVVLTHGADGAEAWSRRSHWRVPGVRVEVADTVGAGDTFTAGLLAHLHDIGALAKPALAGIADQAVEAALSFAARAAAITASRIGADPPWRHELAAARP